MSAPAYEHNGTPCSRDAFYAIACDPRRHVAVEACAGAGKTWMLVSRILRALLDGAEPHEILAITFTKKAAGEMRQRLQEWLADFARPRGDETPEQWQQRLHTELGSRGIELKAASTQREKLQNLYQSVLAHGRTVQIRTFHSWFAALLRSAPRQALADLGLPASYELLEDTTDAVAELWRRWLPQVAADASLRVDYAELVAQLGRTRAHEALASALDKRVEFMLADDAGHVDEAVAPFDAVYPRLAGVAHPSDWLLQRAAGRELLDAAARALGGMAATYAAKGGELQAALQAGDWSGVLCALFTGEGGSGSPRVFSKKADQAQAMETVRAAQNEADTLRIACQQHDARQYHQRLARLVRPLIEEFSLLKQERGWIDMGDIERAALTLLSDDVLSGWVQQRLDARVRHLLIDEFQDTNPLQWQALHAWLQSYVGAGGGGEGPSVFIVGDPKQSIYRFRRAEPQVFIAAQRFITEGLGGDLLACDHTRRNAPAVLAAVNQVMAQAQTAGDYAGFRPHTTESPDTTGGLAALPLIPRPETAQEAGELPEWRDSLREPRTLPEETLMTLEARQAAHWLAAQIAAGTPPRELMVLARKRAPLSVLHAELRALGIACEQPEDRVLGELPAVRDMLALVDALVSPGHDLSLARALRSPLFSLPDEDLVRIALAVRAAREETPSPLWGEGRGEGPAAQPARSARPSWLDALSRTELIAQNAQALHADLMLYQGWLLSLPPHDALQAIYDHRDVLARFAAAAPPPERAATLSDLRALLAAALQVQGGRFLTAYQWLRALRRQSLAAPRPSVQNAVRLLTVHGAKGLEADTVLLLHSAAAPEGRGGGPTVLIDWPGEARVPGRLAFLPSDKAVPPSLQDLARQEAEARAREELNALYVAMTRARHRLVLSGVTPYREPASSWWQRLAPLAEPIEAAAPADTAVATADAEASFTVLTLPPALVQSTPTATDSITFIEAEAAEPTDASRLGEAMHWLLEHVADTPTGWRPQRVAQAMRRFGVTSAQAARAEALARAIHTGEAVWAWNADEVLDAFDEVELTHQGQRLRIDRLVRRRAGTHGDEAWWVLDYKSATRPEDDPLLQAQLAQYRAAVARLHPGAVVQAAFLSADGRLTPV